MFAVVRDWLGVGSLDEQENPHKNMLKGVFECIYCMSVWVGIFFSILHFSATNVSFYIALPFALSAVVIFLEILHE